jgi:hypothetical protein
MLGASSDQRFSNSRSTVSTLRVGNNTPTKSPNANRARVCLNLRNLGFDLSRHTIRDPVYSALHHGRNPVHHRRWNHSRLDWIQTNPASQRSKLENRCDCWRSPTPLWKRWSYVGGTNRSFEPGCSSDYYSSDLDGGRRAI